LSLSGLLFGRIDGTLFQIKALGFYITHKNAE